MPSDDLTAPAVKTRIEHETSVIRSGRVIQMESMFDVPITEKTHQAWDVDMPLDERPWNVGLIVGPSGAGKSSVARAAFGDALVGEQAWSADRSLLDDFPAHMGIREIVGLLSAVGFNSPPAWMRPFRTLSNGEQFRVSCARALADTTGVVAIDEFTSVVDRQVAQVSSHTVQKTVRRNNRQLVAISCHYDVVDWLQPDWVYQPHTATFTWRSVQPRPSVELRFAHVRRSDWGVFKQHHYLSSEIQTSADCYGAFVGDQCVAFLAIRHFPHAKTRNIKMIHRLVVLPDWQGMGIALAFNNWMGQRLYRLGFRLRSTVAHPAMIAGFARSPRWDDVSTARRVTTAASSADRTLKAAQTDPRRYSTRSFQYRPPRARPVPARTGTPDPLGKPYRAT